MVNHLYSSEEEARMNLGKSFRHLWREGPSIDLDVAIKTEEQHPKEDSLPDKETLELFI